MEKGQAAVPQSHFKRDRLKPNNLGTWLLLGSAAFAFGQVIVDSNLKPATIVWLTVGLVVTCCCVAMWGLPFPQKHAKFTFGLLTIGLAWQLIQLLIKDPGMYITPAFLKQLWLFRTLIVLGGCCTLLSLAPDRMLSRRWRGGMAAIAFLSVLLGGVWMIHASPTPLIDTFIFQQTSSKALLQGENPYLLSEPSIYGDNMAYYGPKLVENGRMTIGNPYPPLSIYISLLGYLFAGDIRYCHLLALILAGVGMARLYPRRETLLAAYLFVFTPRTFFVVEQSWTEPVVLLLVVAVVWCALNRPAWTFIALGLLIASKQYMVFMLPLSILLLPASTSKWTWIKTSALAVGVAFVVTAPLAFWDFQSFLWNVGLAQLYQVFRLDAYSFVAYYAVVSGQYPSSYIAFGLLFVALFLTWRFSEHSPSSFTAAMAFCLLLFFAFNRQASGNYYYLLTGLLCIAMAALPLESRLRAPELVEP